MIIEVEEHIRYDAEGRVEPGSEIHFGNSRNKSRFIAFADETPGNWIVTRQGGPRTPGVYAPETWGFVQEHGDSWIAYPGNLPDTVPVSCDTRAEALDCVTNSPEGEQPTDTA